LSSISFENYSKLATSTDIGYTEVSGRYQFQSSAERRIVLDVIEKMRLSSEDSLLEIGCGPGNLLIPLSYIVNDAMGIDNEAMLARLAARGGASSKVTLIAGDFLSMPAPPRAFSKILIYSVIQYMEDFTQAVAFAMRALSLLAPGGRLLLGDLPNRDKKARFQSTPEGMRAASEWRSELSTAGPHPISGFPADSRLVEVNDVFILRLLELTRQSGFESYVLPQPSNLPFGNSREDLLFVAPR
jgi:SAM-dependent methyltransferase